MWHDRGHMSIHLNDDTAIYKEALQDTEVGVIIVSDTMGKLLLSFNYFRLMTFPSIGKIQLRFIREDINVKDVLGCISM